MKDKGGKLKAMKVNEMIKNERELNGLTQKELAEKSGYNNYQTILSMEKGERSISIGDVSRIAKALNLNPEYFLTENFQDENPVLWRECKDKSKCRLYENRLKKYLDDYADLKQFLKEHYNKFIPDSMSVIRRRYAEELKSNKYKFAGKLASDFRNSYYLGDYPSGTLRKAIADLGILIFTFNLESAGSAASFVNENGAAILINRDNAPWRVNFDIAHELYHILTWNLHKYIEKNNNFEAGELEEKYANAFAASILMPRSSVLRDFEQLNEGKQSIDETFIIQGAVKYMVSIQAFMSRLDFLGCLKSDKKDDLLKHCETSRFWNSFNEEHRTTHNVDEYPIEYFMLVMRAWEKQKLSKMKFAHYLNKNIGEIDYYLNKRSVSDG
ncbi:TPA: hypothetical protein DCW38_06530 [candidate division WOR-3 bacterium]|uniref:HTH cro/C1-type domain-containing protein n=1 Tax=candidate division WOR-3 bacterium TaxID=2052148 RepID=A0A350HBA3_UNCW3|nr:hypothetical protein [candidate division WOR-3 bacterium]